MKSNPKSKLEEYIWKPDTQTDICPLLQEDTKVIQVVGGYQGQQQQ